MIDDNDIDHFICKQREVKEMIRKEILHECLFSPLFLLSIVLISEDEEKQKQKEDNYQGN